MVSQEQKNKQIQEALKAKRKLYAKYRETKPVWKKKHRPKALEGIEKKRRFISEVLNEKREIRLPKKTTEYIKEEHQKFITKRREQWQKVDRFQDVFYTVCCLLVGVYLFYMYDVDLHFMAKLVLSIPFFMLSFGILSFLYSVIKRYIEPQEIPPLMPKGKIVEFVTKQEQPKSKAERRQEELNRFYNTMLIDAAYKNEEANILLYENPIITQEDIERKKPTKHANNVKIFTTWWVQ